MRSVWIVLGSTALVAAQASAQNAPVEPQGPLSRYATCKFSDNLHADSTARLPGSGIRFRAVTTPKGEKQISAVDGYRFLLSQGRPSYFADVQVEQSDFARYDGDKDAAIDNLHYVLQSAVGKPYWEHDSRDGFDISGETDSAFDERGPTGRYVLAHDATRTLITINFLGQAPEDRRFVTIDEHDGIRDRVIDALIKCGSSYR